MLHDRKTRTVIPHIGQREEIIDQRDLFSQFDICNDQILDVLIDDDQDRHKQHIKSIDHR